MHQMFVPSHWRSVQGALDGHTHANESVCLMLMIGQDVYLAFVN